ncbi:MAG: hypothetical protein AB7F40_09765 [Victivallaceae bacterium]|nr:hypothetical protein [Victivallaceae bacterium]
MNDTYLIVAVVAAFIEQILTFRLFYKSFDDYFFAWKYLLLRRDRSTVGRVIDLMNDDDEYEYDGVLSPVWNLALYMVCGAITGVAVYKGLVKFFG